MTLVGDPGLGTSALLELGAARADRVRFSRPAVRVAVYARASSAERRRVHDALASVLTDWADEDLRVWHRAFVEPGRADMDRVSR